MTEPWNPDMDRVKKDLDLMVADRDHWKKEAEGWRVQFTNAANVADKLKEQLDETKLFSGDIEGALRRAVEEANRTGQAMGAARAAERISEVEAERDRAILNAGKCIADDRETIATLKSRLEECYQANRHAAKAPAPEPARMPVGTRWETEDGVHWVVLTGTRPPDNRWVRASAGDPDIAFVRAHGRLEPITRRVAETVLALLSKEATPFDALVARARTVEPRDTEPPRREAVVGKPSTWEEAEAGEGGAEFEAFVTWWADYKTGIAFSPEEQDAAWEAWSERADRGTPAPEPEDRTEPPPRYIVCDTPDAMAVAWWGPDTGEGDTAWYPAESHQDAVERCWRHRDEVLASAKRGTPGSTEPPRREAVTFPVLPTSEEHEALVDALVARRGTPAPEPVEQCDMGDRGPRDMPQDHWAAAGPFTSMAAAVHAFSECARWHLAQEGVSAVVNPTRLGQCLAKMHAGTPGSTEP